MSTREGDKIDKAIESAENIATFCANVGEDCEKSCPFYNDADGECTFSVLTPNLWNIEGFYDRQIE